MKFLSVISTLALAAFVLAEKAEAPKELKIERTHIPAECTVLAAAGDSIEVHYKGTLFTTGKEFDSRFVYTPSCRME
jgi:FK506-binding protein 2